MGNVGSSEEGNEETPGQVSSTAKPTSEATVAHQEILVSLAVEMQNGRDAILPALFSECILSLLQKEDCRNQMDCEL